MSASRAKVFAHAALKKKLVTPDQARECLRVHHKLKQSGKPDYIDAIVQEPTEAIPGLSPDAAGVDTEDADPLFDEAIKIVTETRRASISGVQRRLKIGYNRAARIIEQMELEGMIGPQIGSKGREVLMPTPGVEDEID